MSHWPDGTAMLCEASGYGSNSLASAYLVYRDRLCLLDRRLSPLALANSVSCMLRGIPAKR